MEKQMVIATNYEGCFGGVLSLSELSDMFQNYLSLVSVINRCMGNGKRNPRIFAMLA
jgi:hypothetical protein